MDKSTIIGMILALIAVGVGMVLKGVSLVALFNPAALLIIFAGTAATIFIAFPMDDVKKIPKLLGIIFKKEKEQNIKGIIVIFTKWAELTRREGILALETQMEEVDDSFLSSGLQLAIDGQPPDFIRDVMLEKVDAMERRHKVGASIFTQAGTYAPTLGVLGAVIGLVASLSNLDDMEVLGSAISAAFIATLFGIFTGYVFWHPFANKLKEKSKKEVHAKQVMVEGILSLTAGESPQILKDKLSSYLSEGELEDLDQEVANAKEEATE